MMPDRGVPGSLKPDVKGTLKLFDLAPPTTSGSTHGSFRLVEKSDTHPPKIPSVVQDNERYLIPTP